MYTHLVDPQHIVNIIEGIYYRLDLQIILMQQNLHCSIL